MAKKSKDTNATDKLDQIIKEKKEKNDILKKLLKGMEKTNDPNK